MEFTDQFIIAAAGKDAIEVQNAGLPCLNLAYSLTPRGGLQCDRMVSNPRRSILGISNVRHTKTCENPSLLSDDILSAVKRLGFSGVFADLEEPLAAGILPVLDAVLHKHGIPLFVPCFKTVYTSHAFITIETAISGGIFREYVREYTETYAHIAAQVTPVSAEFLLPAQDAAGTPVSREDIARRIREQNASVFFSSELCCNYFTFTDSEQKGHFVIFDDARTLQKKVSILQEAGIGHIFIVYPHFLEYIKEQAG